MEKKKIIINEGDIVKLLNGFEGNIKNIDKRKNKFTISGEYDFLWFHIIDIILINNIPTIDIDLTF